ncbi:MAG TPA: FtsQ-type POTRA domain-containing protein [bacterium]|jgi:hypothetical protein
MNLDKVTVRGNTELSTDEIIGMASLDGANDVWAMALPVNYIEEEIGRNPKIDYVEVRHSGLKSIDIFVMERKGVGAARVNCRDFIFDSDGELLDIRPAGSNPGVPLVTGMQPGVIKYNDQPLYKMSEKWNVIVQAEDGYLLAGEPTYLDRQFERLIFLLSFLDYKRTNTGDSLNNIQMDFQGKMTLEFNGFPPMKIGLFDNGREQIRRVESLIAAMADESLAELDPSKIEYFDISTIEYPHYVLAGNHLERSDREIGIRMEELMAEKEIPAGEEESAEEDDTSETETYYNHSIFSLTGNG